MLSNIDLQVLLILRRFYLFDFTVSFVLRMFNILRILFIHWWYIFYIICIHLYY